MEARQAWRDELARLRHERDQWRDRANRARSEATEYRRRRDFLSAIQADERAREYRANVKLWTEKVILAKGRV